VADKRITDLTAITAAGVDADTDVLALADVSAAETKKVTVTDAVQKGINSLPPGSIDGNVIIDGTLDGAGA
jgi:predicted extracellular nuclease